MENFHVHPAKSTIPYFFAFAGRSLRRLCLDTSSFFWRGILGSGAGHFVCPPAAHTPGQNQRPPFPVSPAQSADHYPDCHYPGHPDLYIPGAADRLLIRSDEQRPVKSRSLSTKDPPCPPPQRP